MEVADLVSDRFEIEQSIATGGMGQVFRAHDRASGELVAVKVIASDAQGHRLRSARFAREVELLSTLSHPGIVRYISHGRTLAGELFLVMEWLDGEELKARLERAPPTMHEAVKLATRVAEALGAAHAIGIVHRDLKPSNLFLVGGHIEQVKVLDFGIAQQEGRTQLTRTGVLLGTPGYMAPEQARSQATIDARADVFALGCVLFECLTGAPPFEGGTSAAVLAKILFGDTPRVSARRPDVPEDLDVLVTQMLAKDPALRPSDGANLAAALAALGPLAHTAAVAPSADGPKPVAITTGERRLLSVVLLGRDPEEGEPALADEVLQRAVRPYGGRLEQLADGSTIVVLEDDRQIATDQAAQAARCALALRPLAQGRPMAVAMGRAESTRKLPEGDVIDRAAQLISQRPEAVGAGPGSALPRTALPRIALDDMTAGLLDARFDVGEDGDGDGLVLGGERALMQGARTLLGRPTSCVGRDWELGALTAILDECIDEPQARAAVVTAPAGMGKSRLAAELVSRVRQRGDHIAIWVGRGDSLRAGSTLDLLAQALRGALGIQGGEPLPERHDKIRAWVAERVPQADQQRMTELLGELVGAPFPDGEDSSAQLKAARQDAQLMSELLRTTWLDFLQAETSAHPVLLVLEDLHWGDFGTVRFIDAALRDRSQRPWMVLALARPEVFDIFPKLWADRPHVQEIRLKELGRKAGERLVRQVLGASVGPDTIERLVKQADGNAFYLEELIRAVAEGKDTALPETVLAMVETRLGRLPFEARRVLRAASVFGEVCWESGVTLLMGGIMGNTMVGEWVAKLAEQEMLTVRPESRFPGERELVFRHALLREGAYAMLTEEDKRRGHHLAGMWLEQHGEGDPMALASHFERGGDRARAASFYLRAAEQAFYVLDLDAALARTSLGLACTPTDELRNALLGFRCEATAQSIERVAAGVADAEALLRAVPRGSIPWTQALAVYLQGTLVTGRMAELLAALEELREVDPAPEATGRMALPLITGICVLDSIGKFADATQLEARFFEVVRPTLDREPLARLWWDTLFGLRAAYAHEDPWAGLVHSEAIQAIFDALGDERTFLILHLFRGINLWYLGASEAAERALEDVAAADVSLGIGGSQRRLALSWLLADRGALAEARELATQLTEYGRAHHLLVEEGRGHWALAEALRRMGDHEAAEREIEAALAMAIPFDHPGMLGTLAALRLAQGRARAQDALVAAEDAVARCAGMGGCGMFRGAFVRLAHAEALHATGAHDAARHAIADARERLLAIAGRIPDPAYKQSFLEAVPENAKTFALARAWLGDDGP